jgi:hypothetical protein
MLYVGFYFCVNDNRDVNGANAQVTWCILCYNSLVTHFSPLMKSRKGWDHFKIQWNNKIERICGCKTFNHCKIVWRSNEYFIEKKFGKITYKKKQPNVFWTSIYIYISAKYPFKKDNVQLKNFKPLAFLKWKFVYVKNVWWMHLCLWMVSFHKNIFHKKKVA